MILDCFTFFNELDLLDIRLHTLATSVDKFVISESDHTFQGQPKPYHYFQNRHLFRNFESKIIWVPVKAEAGSSVTPWEREGNQRRAIRRNLWTQKYVSRNDIVLLSDVDEIPDLTGKVVEEARPWVHLVQNHQPVTWVMNMTYYWVDLMISAPWRGTVAMMLGDIDSHLNGDFQTLRDYRGVSSRLVYPGGWHFSFLGGADAIKTKIEAFSHTEYRGAANDQNIQEAIGERWKQGRDVFGRDIYQFRPLATEERQRLPGYLTRNRSRFSGFFGPYGEDQRADGSERSDPAHA